MQRRQPLLTIICFIASMIFLQNTQPSQCTTYDTILQHIKKYKPPSQVIEEESTAILNTFYTFINPSERSYIYFGHGGDEISTIIENKLTYNIKFDKFSSIESPTFPHFHQCTLFYKYQKKNLSIDFLPNTIPSTKGTLVYEYSPSIPTFNINQGMHIIQCEFIAPNKGYIDIKILATYPRSEETHHSTLSFQTKSEEKSGIPLKPEEKIHFSTLLIVKPDKYTPIKSGKVKAEHEIIIGNLSKAYSNGESFSIRLTGYEFQPLVKEMQYTISCSITQTLKNTDERIQFIRKVILSYDHLGTNSYHANPRLRFDTDKNYEVEYFAESVLHISCPDILLYRGRDTREPNHFVTRHIIAYSSTNEQALVENDGNYYCIDYPCTVITRQEKRNDDNGAQKPDCQRYIIPLVGCIILSILIIGLYLRRKLANSYEPIDE